MLALLPPFTLLVLWLGASVSALGRSLGHGRPRSLREGAPGLLEPGPACAAGVPCMTTTTAAASILMAVREWPASGAALVLALTPVFGMALPGETTSPVQAGGAAPILGELQAVGRGRTPTGRWRPPSGPRRRGA